MSIARGFIKGFIGQSLDSKAAADQRLAEFTDRISVDYLNNKLPAFLENEKNMQKRYNLIEKNMGKNSALYASAQGLTETDAMKKRMTQIGASLLVSKALVTMSAPRRIRKQNLKQVKLSY